jgi:hypothetical protein
MNSGISDNFKVKISRVNEDQIFELGTNVPFIELSTKSSFNIY